ncbi:MAG: FMN-binding protein [Lachnospiraceae bacterium]|uniref:FMN-binding protein n=1 Tax=Parablautia sp. Marseille-Q6255 TaxID=3039593 RepID=UPI0024BCD003|nr:FMN-binding protein [Parablautia sp. Marseille-Q6255]
MKNKEVRGVLALVLVTALSFGVIAGSRVLSQNMAASDSAAGTPAAPSEATFTEEFDTAGSETIDRAGKTQDGYLVTVREKGYGGDIVMNVFFDDTASVIAKVEVTELSETQGVGSKIAEADFLSQFEGQAAPVALAGAEAAADNAADQAEAVKALDSAELSDGTYEAKTEAPDDSGFIDQVSITVKDGKITSVSWDAVTADGAKKSVMSENGEYTMTEDGLTWKEQAEALAAALIENQSLSSLTMDEQGKTDVVSGVSISIGGFVDLARQCLEQAAGIEPETQAPADDAAVAETEGTSGASQIDAISGATISSTAAVKGINDAYEFLQTVK